MDDFSYSRIYEDSIIFSTYKINIRNATMQRGSVIILGGDREILRDVLNYKREAATKKADQTGSNYKTNTLTGRDGIASSSPPPPEEEFQFI